MSKKLSHKIFHSKVLLFGEHIINLGAKGLAVPFDHYDGLLKSGKLSDDKTFHSNQSLQKLADFIIAEDHLTPLYDTNQFLDDLEKGLYFDSTIPQGYGLGSSGALVAALYHRYRKPNKKPKEVGIIKKELAELESYFHGKSSGLDPIVCYTNQAVLITKGEVSEVFHLPKSDSHTLQIFLINTHIERKTAPFVNLFLNKCKDKKFMSVVEKSLIPTNNIAIESFLKKKYDSLMNSVKLISQLHADLMPEFIPPKFREAWLHGLKYNEFHLKICGAGGGGFIIGFARADTNLPTFLGGMEIIELMKF
ncbi:MAG: mevalonate kinase [Bacteroidetes bacterium]|nr:mevalonate kinase [Bacteroidota bacterium]